ncbi:esterase/lipase family protein [Cerasicoccus fimbriatus]|uniref:esterase/lipase family protein n=1 Tax=Cerasicoccus fimbriatus TaxID=3014554 RepID=UPI0022B56DC0|nr:alpha/beta fold hydrolase [Cerasicoccus sp. TK19100]
MRWFVFLWLLPVALFAEKQTVVLLHGLAASSGTMVHIESTLEAAGYLVVNLDYPSMSESLETISANMRARIVAETAEAEQVHFVTHSMGGIVLRMIQRDAPLDNIGRVVMIAPPNHGSDAVNVLQGLPGFLWAIGPSGARLAAGDNESLASLGPPNFELGVIAGSKGLDPFISSMIPGPDDGVVSIESTKLEGMADFTVVHDSHPVLVFNGQVMDQILAFLEKGEFIDKNSSPQNPFAGNWTHRR